MGHLQTLFDQCLQQAGITIDAVTELCSIELKADETGLIELAQRLQLPYHTYTAAQLQTTESQLSTRSDYIYKITGVYGVAESAALFAAKQRSAGGAELILTKQKTARATCAIARY